jgi:hypothetical protein
MKISPAPTNDIVFSGNIFMFHAFDIGDDINLDGIKQTLSILVRPRTLSKYFKNYHAPLSIDLPHPHTSSRCAGASLHSFGVISLVYKIPFNDTLENVRKNLNLIDAEFQEQSVVDAGSLFRAIKQFVKQPRFFHLRTTYVVIQADTQPEQISTVEIKERYGGIIADMLRFETETLAEHQRNEILASAIGYYRGDLFIIDTHAAFVYDEDYQDVLDLFEFANIQQLELQYFDRMLDKQLNVVYRQEVRHVPLKLYLPFISTVKDPVESLNILKVEIAVITERLKSSIKLAGEEYISELYSLLVEKLDINNWKAALDDKLEIIKDINSVYQRKIDARREDLLSVLIIVLIFIELIVGILHLLKK